MPIATRSPARPLLAGRARRGQASGPSSTNAYRWFFWLTPLCVYLAIVGSVLSIDRLLAGLVAVFIIVAASRRPDRALIALVVLLPLQVVLPAWLYASGLSLQIVRPLSSWKEAVILGILAGAARSVLRGERRRKVTAGRRQLLDRFELVALAFTALVGLYALVPRLVSAEAPTGLNPRLAAFRASAGFVLLAVATRHTVFPPGFLDRLRRAVLAIGLVVAGIAIFEWLFSSVWNDFAVKTLEVTRYQAKVLNVAPRDWGDIRVYGFVADHRIIRVGSVFFTPLVLAFYLLPAFALVLEDVVRRGLRASNGVALFTLGGALLLTQTRAGMVGAIVIALVAFRPLPGRATSNRVRLGLVLAAVVVLAVPAASSTGLAGRVTSASSGQEQSAVDHWDAFWRGIRAVSSDPIGHGLATSAGTGQRFFGGDTTITENYYLQVGVETGVLGMALFVSATVLFLRRLTEVGGRVANPTLAGLRGGLMGVAVGAFFLHAWNELAVALTAWGAAGAALGVAERASERRAPAERRPLPPLRPAMMAWRGVPSLPAGVS